LEIANSLWGQYDYTFLSPFLDTLAMNYGAGLRLTDFAGDPEGSRQEINDWVSAKTNERIKDLIPSGGINSLTRLVLANAIYFKADWLHQFDKNLTVDAPFNLLDGSQETVSMMGYEKPKMLPYAIGPGYQAVSLPYVGDDISMLVLVPDAGTFEGFEADLSAEGLNEIVAALEPRTATLVFPKFQFESKFNLADTLVAMGMLDAFDATVADFSAMDGTKDLFIGGVYHKAFVAVDEKGTEAAAATAVVMQLESVSMPDLHLVVDRPFIFLIRDNASGTILFLGRVVNPIG
jgi:serpin B